MNVDEYEAKLREKRSGSFGLVVYVFLVVGITLLGDALYWLFWERVFK